MRTVTVTVTDDATGEVLDQSQFGEDDLAWATFSLEPTRQALEWDREKAEVNRVKKPKR